MLLDGSLLDERDVSVVVEKIRRTVLVHDAGLVAMTRRIALHTVLAVGQLEELAVNAELVQTRVVLVAGIRLDLELNDVDRNVVFMLE